MRDNMSQILETNNALMKSIKHLSVENDVLKSQIASLSDEVIKVVNSKKSPKPPTTDQSERSKLPTLLIGGSPVWIRALSWWNRVVVPKLGTC